MKRILAMAVLVGLGIFLSIQVVQARGDDIGDDKMYQYDGPVDSGTPADAKSDNHYSEKIQNIVDFNEKYKPITSDKSNLDRYEDRSQDWIDYRWNNDHVAITDSVRTDKVGNSSLATPAIEPAISQSSAAMDTTTIYVPDVSPSVYNSQTNSEKIQDILDYRAEFDDRKADKYEELSESWIDHRGIRNDSKLLEPTQSSTMNHKIISEPIQSTAAMDTTIFQDDARNIAQPIDIRSIDTGSKFDHPDIGYHSSTSYDSASSRQDSSTKIDLVPRYDSTDLKLYNNYRNLDLDSGHSRLDPSVDSNLLNNSSNLDSYTSSNQRDVGLDNFFKNGGL